MSTCGVKTITYTDTHLHTHYPLPPHSCNLCPLFVYLCECVIHFTISMRSNTTSGALSAGYSFYVLCPAWIVFKCIHVSQMLNPYLSVDRLTYFCFLYIITLWLTFVVWVEMSRLLFTISSEYIEMTLVSSSLPGLSCEKTSMDELYICWLALTCMSSHVAQSRTGFVSIFIFLWRQRFTIKCDVLLDCACVCDWCKRSFVAMGIVFFYIYKCVCVHLCILACVYFYESVHVWGRARLCECSAVDSLSAQVNLTLSGHTSGVCRPVRRALSHQQH